MSTPKARAVVPSGEDVLRAAGAFELRGRPTGVAAHRGGHIHRSWAVTCEGPEPVGYFVQQLNTGIFLHPELLMSNIVRVTEHLRARGEPTLTVVPAVDGRHWWRSDDGGMWRVFELIDGAHSSARVVSAAQAETVGYAFGRFAAVVATLPGPPLAETIGGFHDLRWRVAQLTEAVDADGEARVAGARTELAALRHYEPLVAQWEKAVAMVPRRIAHNDAKTDNVLVDDESGQVRAVVDLDTVMPGSLLADLGDLLRSAAGSLAEDAPDASSVVVDDEQFAAVVRGYARGLGDPAFVHAEAEHIVLAGQAITYEQAVRFLTDHLMGDHYFRTERPDHNLVRARAQLALLGQLHRHELQLAVRAREAVEQGGGKS